MKRLWKRSVRIMITFTLVVFAFSFSPSYIEAADSEFITKGATNEKLVALTFDDDTYGTLISPILRALAKKKVKATFFVTGSGVLNHPQAIQNIVSKGHQLGNHSYSHPDFTTLTATQMKDELDRTDALIQQLIGKSTKPYFRAPFGAVNTNVLAAVGAAGYTKTIQWDVGTRDWQGIPASDIVNTVVSQVVPGSIVLMHCTGGAIHTPAALPDIISQLKAKGYRFVTVEQLLAASSN